MERRVVVTGMGCITPLGNEVDEMWCRMIRGQSGIRAITRFDPAEYQSRIAGECDFDPADYMSSKEARRMDRFQQMALAAALDAVRESRLEVTPDNAPRIGVAVGSGIGGILSMTQQFRNLFDRGPGRVSPFIVPMQIVDLASGLISIRLGAKGPNYAIVSACATGAHSIGEAAEIIRRGRADVMIAGGAEAGICEMPFAGFGNMRALSTRNDEPERASRPFDIERDGFILSEGAGVLIVEELEHAQRRDAPILAEVVGYGSTGDASHITDPAPGGEGAARAMEMALLQAELRPEDIDYINAHGTSTMAGDRAETAGIKHVFGDHAYRMPVSSTKSMTGHCLGAAGAIEAIATIQSIRQGIAPPTINLDHPDPECDLDYVPHEARRLPINVAMSNSFGFGGHNASLIFQAAE